MLGPASWALVHMSRFEDHLLDLILHSWFYFLEVKIPAQINSGGLEEFIGSSYVIISTFVIVVGELFAI